MAHKIERITNDGITKSTILKVTRDGTGTVEIDLGFRPNYVRWMNLTSGIDRYEWYRGFDATKTIKNGTGAYDATSQILVNGSKVTLPEGIDKHVLLVEVR